MSEPVRAGHCGLPPAALASVAFALLASMMLSGCAGLLGSRGTPVAVSELRHASVCNSVRMAAAVTMLPDIDALRAWQEARGIDLIGDAPLPPGPFAVVEHGARNSGGYDMIIGRPASIDGGVLSLQASFLAPASDEQHSGMETSPCSLILLPAGNYGAVELLDSSGSRRAISSTPPVTAPATSTPTQ